MKTLRFDREESYLGDTILVPIRLLDDHESNAIVAAYLDTGAQVSVFDNSIPAAIGIDDVTTGRRIRMGVADGRATVGYVHDIRIGVFGLELTIPVCFCPEWPPDTRNLLGMEGFLDQLTIALDHSDRRLYVNRKR